MVASGVLGESLRAFSVVFCVLCVRNTIKQMRWSLFVAYCEFILGLSVDWKRMNRTAVTVYIAKPDSVPAMITIPAIKDLPLPTP